MKGIRLANLTVRKGAKTNGGPLGVRLPSKITMEQEFNPMNTEFDQRTKDVVDCLVEAVRSALVEMKVTPEEYRAGIHYLLEAADANELSLLVDAFCNITICEIANAQGRSSAQEMQGPYFLEDVPRVSSKIATDPEFEHKEQKMIVRGEVHDADGKPLPGTDVFIWQSTPDGKYSGIHPGVPKGTYRGIVTTDDEGRFEVGSTVPVPYHMKDDGPVGALYARMGRHSWRPAHVHFKVRRPGFKELTTQVYFENGDWVGDDSCHGARNPELIMPEKYEDGARLVEVRLVIEATEAPVLA